MSIISGKESDSERIQENHKIKTTFETDSLRHNPQFKHNDFSQKFLQVKNKEEASARNSSINKNLDYESSFESIPSIETKTKLTMKMKLNQALSDRALNKKELVLPKLKCNRVNNDFKRTTSNDPPARSTLNLKLQPINRKMS